MTRVNDRNTAQNAAGHREHHTADQAAGSVSAGAAQYSRIPRTIQTKGSARTGQMFRVQPLKKNGCEALQRGHRIIPSAVLVRASSALPQFAQNID